MKILNLISVAIFMLTLSLKAQVSSNFTAYTVAHNNGDNNVLFEFKEQSNLWTEIGPTGTNNIKAIATDPINKIIYAVNGDTFGQINSQTGMFSPTGIIGQASGDYGTVILNNIEGLTFDLTNKIMYATHRIESGENCNNIPNSNDLLFQINIVTGQVIVDTMLDSKGEPADYSVIGEIIATSDFYCLAYDVNDIAYNIYTGDLYALQNNDTDFGVTIINQIDGTVESYIYDLLSDDIVGLGFNSFGELFGTTGLNAPTSLENSFNFIDLTNQTHTELSNPDATGTNFGFESLDFFGAFNDLALKLTSPATTLAPVSGGDEVVFTITVYNQGQIENNDISINNYIPDGLILNDPTWTLIPGTTIANYVYTQTLAPGSEITISIKFTVDNNFTGNEIKNCASIAASFSPSVTDNNGNFISLSDFDSYPSDYNDELNGRGIVVDDEINQGGYYANEDEDDHDIAIIAFYNRDSIKPFPCYSVSENSGTFPNTLFEYNPSTQKWIRVGEVGPASESIQAIATDPINNIIYAYNSNQNVLGIIDPNSATPSLFSPINTNLIGKGVGTANGDYGTVKLDSIVAITYDPVNMILYGVHRIYSGDICNPIRDTNDLLFQIDVSTGRFIPGAMLDSSGNPVGYAVIGEAFDDDAYSCEDGSFGGIVYDVSGIAYNAYTGELFALQNQGESEIITIIDNYMDGSILSGFFNITEDSLRNFGFSYLGNLYANYKEGNYSDLMNIDLIQNSTSFISNIEENSNTPINLAAFDCFTAFNDLALSCKTKPGNSFIINEGSTVSFLLNVYNQGDIANTNIALTSYIPTGLTLADTDWTTTTNGKASYTITQNLNAGDLITVPIAFTVNAGFEGKTITLAAEISESFSTGIIDLKGEDFELPLPDLDSYPDDENDEIIDGDPITDNDINSGGSTANEDEDDHDIASITILKLDEDFSLQTNITPDSCNGSGATEIILSGNAVAPYTYKWFDSLGNTIHLQTSNNLVHQVTNLTSGLYYVIVNDAADKTSSIVVNISDVASNNGNLNCSNSCPEYLTTSSSSLNGVFQAAQVVEIKGFIDGSQNAEFRICE